MMPSVSMQRQTLQPRPALPLPCRSALRQKITCRLVSTRRAVLGSLCGCGLCQGRLRWYDRYFAWNMANFEEQYEGLIGSRKADLFADFLPSKGQERIQLVDIGAGTLPNSRYYKDCSKVTAVDPNLSMEPYAQENARLHGLTDFEVVEGVAEQLPFEDATFDRAVCTLVFCSVPDLEGAVREVKRVLKSNGKLLFWDHIYADPGRPLLRLSQEILNPLQQVLADGCHLNRNPLPFMKEAGFAIEQQQQFTVEGLGPIGPHQCGIAVASA